MSYVIGIDTGGTYTDCVLLDTEEKGKRSVKKRAKAFTTHENLEIGIEDSLKRLSLNSSEIAQTVKVVLSTTLATNAIVENRIHSVGLILIGAFPQGNIATRHTTIVQGNVNIKGRVTESVSRSEVDRAIDGFPNDIEAIAVSGVASIRNPILEQEVKSLVEAKRNIPVMCGYEFVNDLGFLERTNTVVMNAGLLPIINNFISAIKNVLVKFNIGAPVFVIRGDGSLVSLDFAAKKPVDTVLSGPAASMVGTVYLTGVKDAIIADMGGTTTDIGIIKNKKVNLSETGAWIGGWNLKVKSARLNTVGLGGDSRIEITKGCISVGPERVQPLCRGGNEGITPTDILHCTGEFVQWDCAMAANKIENQMMSLKIPYESGVNNLEKAVINKIHTEVIKPYKKLGLPVCAIGAPAKSWFGKLHDAYKINLIIPDCFEVANAVGAATAAIWETAISIVRKGEEGHGYLVHAEDSRYMYMDIMDAVLKAIEVSTAYAEELIIKQGLGIGRKEIECIETYIQDDNMIYKKICVDKLKEYKFQGGNEQFIEVTVKVSVGGKIFA